MPRWSSSWGRCCHEYTPSPRHHGVVGRDPLARSADRCRFRAGTSANERRVHRAIGRCISPAVARPCETRTPARQRYYDFPEREGDRLDHQHSDRRLPRVDLGSPLPAKPSCRACLGRLPKIVFHGPITIRTTLRSVVSEYGGFSRVPRNGCVDGTITGILSSSTPASSEPERLPRAGRNHRPHLNERRLSNLPTNSGSCQDLRRATATRQVDQAERKFAVTVG